MIAYNVEMFARLPSEEAARSELATWIQWVEVLQSTQWLTSRIVHGTVGCTLRRLLQIDTLFQTMREGTLVMDSSQVCDFRTVAISRTTTACRSDMAEPFLACQKLESTKTHVTRELSSEGMSEGQPPN